MKKKILQREMNYQTLRYSQLGTAYKNNRRILHDTKKHYMMIREYIEKGQYDKLQGYLDAAIRDTDKAFWKINTGNLVIDSYVHNIRSTGETKGFTVTTDIAVDANRIPVADYDLCVILGNLLDNAENAVNRMKLPGSIDIQIYTTDQQQFIVYIKNSFSEQKENDNHADTEDFEHGYGLTNVSGVVEKYNGICRYKKEGDMFVSSILIPMDS